MRMVMENPFVICNNNRVAKQQRREERQKRREKRREKRLLKELGKYGGREETNYN